MSCQGPGGMPVNWKRPLASVWAVLAADDARADLREGACSAAFVDGSGVVGDDARGMPPVESREGCSGGGDCATGGLESGLAFGIGAASGRPVLSAESCWRLCAESRQMRGARQLGFVPSHANQEPCDRHSQG